MSNEKLIKQGIKYTDQLFEILKERITKQVGNSKDLEEFLARTKEYLIENPLVSTGYVDTMTNLVVSGLNQAEFIRANQRELVRASIQDATSELITNVGEDLKQEVRDIAKQGFDEGLHSRDIAKNITQKIDSINRSRARTIARTETARALTIADYITNKERGAVGFTVVCRPDCCPVCAEDYARVTDKAFKSNYRQIQNLSRQLKTNPRRDDASEIKSQIVELNNAQDSITGSKNGHLIGGEYQFSMDNTEMLPPRHPNCRCSANYVYGELDVQVSTKPIQSTTSTVSTSSTQATKTQSKRTLTNEELNAMSFEELADHYGLRYEKDYDITTKRHTHMFVETFEDGRTLGIYIEDIAVQAYTKKGIATPNEIIAEVMKVPKQLRNETSSITFRGTNHGIQPTRDTDFGYDEIDTNTLGYNWSWEMGQDYEHRIAINPRYFMGGRGRYAKDWIPDDENIVRWKKTIHHEFAHSGDTDKALFESDDYMPHSLGDEYMQAKEKDPFGFTEYANSAPGENWAEHWGYINYMESNPQDQHRLIEINDWAEGKIKINYEEYKKRYPNIYKFFMSKNKKGV